MGSNSNFSVVAGSIAVGGTVQQLLSPGTGPGADQPLSGSVVIKARKGNTSPLYLGNATTGGGTSGSGITAATGFELQPSESVSMDILGVGKLYIFGATTGDKYDIAAVGP